VFKLAWAKNGTPDTLTSAADIIEITDLTSTTFNQSMCYIIPTGTINTLGRFNSDSGNNYAFRNAENGGTDSTQVSTDRWLTHTGAKKNFTNMFIVNIAAQEKLAIYHTSETTVGASNTPGRIEGVGKWTDTTNQINRLSVFDYTGGNNFDAGIVKIWGSD